VNPCAKRVAEKVYCNIFGSLAKASFGVLKKNQENISKRFSFLRNGCVSKILKLANSFCIILSKAKRLSYHASRASGTCTKSFPSTFNLASAACQISSPFLSASGTCRNGKSGYSALAFEKFDFVEPSLVSA
jgi:hypothetical protein